MSVPHAPLVDQAMRNRIRAALDESLLVEASAGTGKTSELVRRLVAMLGSGRAEVSGVVAVTFTRKAAGELKLRLRQALDVARASASSEEERNNLERAAARLEEARIGTIHSFCGDILRERPVEARVDPVFVELAEDDATRLFGRAFRAFFQEALADLPSGMQRALARSSSGGDNKTPVDRLRDAAQSLLDWRDFTTPWRREPFERDREMNALVSRARTLCQRAECAQKPHDGLVSSLEPVVDLLRWLDGAEVEPGRDPNLLEARLVELHKTLPTGNSKKGSGKLGGDVTREELLELRETLGRDLEDFTTRANADLAAVLRQELQPVLVHYRVLKEKLGALDFVDLLISARDLLRTNREVRAHLQQRISHIFVDEFQDTDPLQAEILLLLSADTPDEHRWEEVRPVPGKLFLVGDPKQSIYRFRRADVVLYGRVKRQLLERGVGVVELSHSFRATAPLQDAINAAFGAEIHEDPNIGQPAYVPLRGGPRAPESQPSLVALPVPEPFGYRGVTKSAIAASLPEAAAAYVAWLVFESGWTVRRTDAPEVRRPIAARDIAMLFRRYMSWNTDVTKDYVRALEARGVPHLLVGSRSFHEREEIESIRSALTAIEWPDDELSVFATLRGPLFAIPDDLLFRFRQSAGRLHPFRTLPEDLADALEPVRTALELLKALHRERNHRAIVDTIGSLLRSVRAHAGFALRPAGNQVLANVERLIDLARSFELGGGLSFRGFVERLDEEAESERSVEAPVLEEGADGVRIMTVHSAKGLEFPVVLLADIGANLAHRDPSRHIDGSAGLCAQRLHGCAPWELLEKADEERLRDEAEGIRLAYVAATRARDLLVVPTIGVGPGALFKKDAARGWVSVLDDVLYPERSTWAQPEPAPGCPAFVGNSTVLSGLQDAPERVGQSIAPGRHRTQQDIEVVWWDPKALPPPSGGTYGLRQEHFLAPDASGTVARAGIERYEAWRERAAEAVDLGSVMSISPLHPADAPADPSGPARVLDEIVLERAKHRPHGRRFGTLVHAILRDVSLDGDGSDIERLAAMHGRVLGANEDEVRAAIEPVRRVLDHELIARARKAERRHRELPIVFETEDGQLLDGVIDLAFFERGRWVVVDFKTDADVEARKEQYRRQMQWYLEALSTLTGAPANGVLLAI